jgi:lipoprotein-anchoring transpeptidase ErfK/SrfK
MVAESRNQDQARQKQADGMKLKYPARPRFLPGVATAIGLALVASACTSANSYYWPSRTQTEELYGARPDEQFPVPAAKVSYLSTRYFRRMVDYKTTHKPGTLVVDTPKRYLYFVMPEGKAMRYGIGVGRAGFSWKGVARVAHKKPWPTWTPPKEMIEREPELEKHAKGIFISTRTAATRCTECMAQTRQTPSAGLSRAAVSACSIRT